MEEIDAMSGALTFGALLKRYRLDAGLSQEALAERANLSRRTIQDLERGLHETPRKDTVALLATALGLTPADRAVLTTTLAMSGVPRNGATAHPRASAACCR